LNGHDASGPAGTFGVSVKCSVQWVPLRIKWGTARWAPTAHKSRLMAMHY